MKTAVLRHLFCAALIGSTAGLAGSAGLAAPAVVPQDLERRLNSYAKQKKTSEWLKAQPAFMGPQGKTLFDAGYDIEDGGLPQEKPALPMPVTRT